MNVYGSVTLSPEVVHLNPPFVCKTDIACTTKVTGFRNGHEMDEYRRTFSGEVYRTEEDE